MSRPARREPTVDEVVGGFERGDLRSLGRALSWAEDLDPRGRQVLARVYGHTGRARILGITGAPGAGKSTLVDQLVARLTDAGRKVGIVAVDPTSAFSGGAILGDRIRMRAVTERPGVFVRSMATRGHLGGLARATEDAVDLLDAHGFDDVLVETVGVGQDEIEVAQLAHVNLLVLVPFMGDDVQALKAGVMEIADAYVINKADRDGVDRMEAHLRSMLQLYDGPPREVPILRTVATTGAGVDDLVRTLWDLDPGGEATSTRRRARLAGRLRLLLRDRLLESFTSRDDVRGGFDEAVERVARREVDPYAAVDQLRGAQVRFDHLGVAVNDAEDVRGFWVTALGLEVAGEEAVDTEGVRVTFLPVGEGRIELLEPLPGRPGPVQRFLEGRGPGMHHVCLRVDDLDAALERLSAAGVRLAGEAPRVGAGGQRVAFVHPRSSGGVLVELSEKGRPA